MHFNKNICSYFVTVFASMLILCSCSSSNNAVDGDLDNLEAESEQSDLVESDTDLSEQAESETEKEQAEIAPAYTWSTCPQIDNGKTLAEMAAYFDEVARTQHLSPDGLFRNLYLNENLTDVDLWYHVPNTVLWSGMYLASQALRYEVTGDNEALENARRVVAGLTDLTKVTGVSGLYGRSMSNPDFAYNNVPEDSIYWANSSATGYDGWRFNFDVSKDSYAGIMFGYAVALEHFKDEKLRADIKDRLKEISDHFLGNGLQIIDITGEVTEHGRLFHSALDDYPGFNAMLASSWVKIFETELNDQAIGDFYYTCLMQMPEGRTDIGCPDIEDKLGTAAFKLTSYIDSMEKHMFLLLDGCKHNIDNFDMCYQALYPLVRREKNASLKARLLQVMRNNMFHSDKPDYNGISDLGNSLFTFFYAALSKDDPEDDPILKQAVEDAVCKLKRFPQVKFKRHIPKGEQAEICTSRLDNPCAAKPIPIEEYDFDNYLWRLDFTEIIRNEIQEDKRLVYSPEDFLIAYWLARYHKIISAEL